MEQFRWPVYQQAVDSAERDAPLECEHLTWVDWQKVIAAYWGFCTYIDDQVQRILDCLKETEQWENTVIVFSSDHGDMLGSHRLFNKGFHMYEETHRIPLVISPSSKTQNASICEQFVSLVDL